VLKIGEVPFFFVCWKTPETAKTHWLRLIKVAMADAHWHWRWAITEKKISTSQLELDPSYF
jgi:hypothetical protein